MKTTEKKLPKSQNWKTFKDKLKNYGYSVMLISILWLAWCGSHEIEVKKAAEKYQNAIENVKIAKEKLKNKEEKLEKTQEELQEAKKNLIDAENKEEEAKKELKQESNKL